MIRERKKKKLVLLLSLEKKKKVKEGRKFKKKGKTQTLQEGGQLKRREAGDRRARKPSVRGCWTNPEGEASSQRMRLGKSGDLVGGGWKKGKERPISRIL